MQVSPEKEGPTTLNFVGPVENPVDDSPAQISSRPNTSRFGTPLPVGSGAIHWLYQDWTPGQYCSAQAVPLSAEPEVWSKASVSPFSSWFHVWPKSGDT